MTCFLWPLLQSGLRRKASRRGGATPRGRGEPADLLDEDLPESSPTPPQPQEESRPRRLGSPPPAQRSRLVSTCQTRFTFPCVQPVTSTTAAALPPPRLSQAVPGPATPRRAPDDRCRLVPAPEVGEEGGVSQPAPRPGPTPPPGAQVRAAAHLGQLAQLVGVEEQLLQAAAVAVDLLGHGLQRAVPLVHRLHVPVAAPQRDALEHGAGGRARGAGSGAGSGGGLGRGAGLGPHERRGRPRGGGAGRRQRRRWARAALGTLGPRRPELRGGTGRGRDRGQRWVRGPAGAQTLGRRRRRPRIPPSPLVRRCAAAGTAAAARRTAPPTTAGRRAARREAEARPHRPSPPGTATPTRPRGAGAPEIP